MYFLLAFSSGALVEVGTSTRSLNKQCAAGLEALSTRGSGVVTITRWRCVNGGHETARAEEH